MIPLDMAVFIKIKLTKSLVPVTHLLAMPWSGQAKTALARPMSIGDGQSLIGDGLDPVELSARVCRHPAQVAQEDWQLAQASLQACLKSFLSVKVRTKLKRENLQFTETHFQACLKIYCQLSVTIQLQEYQTDMGRCRYKPRSVLPPPAYSWNKCTGD